MPVVTLGGRAFTPATLDRRSVRMDHYLRGIIARSGVDRILPVDGETDVAYLARLQAGIMAANVAPELLAGYLLPAGITEQSWTPAIAEEVAQHIARCDTEVDRQAVIEQSAIVVMHFFGVGLTWLLSFLSSLSLQPDQPAPKSLQGRIAAFLTWDFGHRWFAALRDSITSALRRFRHGH